MKKINILIEQLEKLTNKKVILKENNALPFLRFYKAAESGAPPHEAILYDCLYILKKYFDDYVKWYNLKGNERTIQRESRIYKDFLTRQKEIDAAIRSNSEKEKLVAIDNGINQWHYDFPSVRHLMMQEIDRVDANSEEGISDEEERKIEKDFFELEEILRKLGRLKETTPYEEN